jgi:hypothetical protein
MVLLALLLASGDPPPPRPAKLAKICRESERVTGSHLRVPRRCLTQEEWDQEDARRDRRPVTMQVTGEQPDGATPGTRPQ